MAATEKMINYAKGIAQILHLTEPNYSDFLETSNFINENQELYKRVMTNRNNELAYMAQLEKLSRYNLKLDDDFLNFVKNLNNEKGIYIFSNDTEIVYIGKSTDLASRIISSLVERCNKMEITQARIIKCKTEADTHILEVVLITELKPTLNRDCMCEDYSNHFHSGIDIYDIPYFNVFKEVGQ